MTTPRTIVRESLLVLPFLAAIGFGMAGVSGLVPVLLGGALSVLNFAALAWALSHLMGDGETAVDPTGIVMVKTLGSLLALAGLMLILNPIWVLVGSNTVVLGIIIRGILDAFSNETVEPMLAEEL